MRQMRAPHPGRRSWSGKRPDGRETTGPMTCGEHGWSAPAGFLRTDADDSGQFPDRRVSGRQTRVAQDVLKAIEEEMRGPTLEARYGLLPDAARLLEWLERLDPKRLQGAWTPPVEDCNTREIGLQQTGGEENLPFYLQILVDEINEKTPYRVTLFS